jgi:hypothetical protein
MPPSGERQGKQQSEMRLMGQKAEQDPAQRRPLVEDQQDSADDRGGDEAVLPDHRRGQPPRAAKAITTAAGRRAIAAMTAPWTLTETPRFKANAQA